MMYSKNFSNEMKQNKNIFPTPDSDNSFIFNIHGYY